MELFDEAVCFAVRKHTGQRRKLGDIPYIVHPMEVASIVATMSEDQNLLAAAVLHDTVEDTDTTLQEVEEHFGKRVYLLVLTETEEKRPELPPAATWKLRKEESLNILANTKDIDVKKLWLGDKLANIRSFHRQFLKDGDKTWLVCNQKDPEQQAWYYRTIANCLSELKEYAAYREYCQLVEEVFAKHKQISPSVFPREE